jgi:hypothetical protein
MANDIIDVVISDNSDNVTINTVINSDVIDLIVTDNRDNILINATPNLFTINVSNTSGNIIGSNYYLVSTLNALPAVGDPTILYVVNDTNKIYRSSNSLYTEISASASTTWGNIGGTLSSQTDLQNALNAKAPLASPTFTGTVSGITKSMVGLGNVDNTTDLLKPISTATQTALNLKYDASNPSNYLTVITSGQITTALGFTPISGTGTSNYLPKFTASTLLGNSNIQDSGSLITLGSNSYVNGNLRVGIVTDAGFRLDVAGTTRFQGTTASDTAPLGSELAGVTGTGTNWALAGGATNLNVGGYTHTTGSVVPLTTSLAAVNGTYYQITYTITGRTAGSITIAYGGTSTSVSATGATGPLASSTAVLTITPTTDFDGTVVLSIKTIGTNSASITFANSSGTVPLEIRASDITTNAFFGRNAGRRNTTGTANTFIGSQNGLNNTTGGSNTFVGNNVGAANTIGANNTFIGTSTGALNTTGFSNSFFGTNTGQNNTTGGFNTFIGQGAGQVNTTGASNTFLGTSAGSGNTTGIQNVFVGQNAGNYNTTAGTNTNIGYFAGGNNITGANNTFLGHNAGRFIADGTTTATSLNQSILIGTATKPLSDTQTNQIVIGYNSTGLGSNTTVLGNSSTTTTAIYGSLLLGTTTSNASAQLQVDSTTKGFLPPRMTTTQKNAISSPATGLVVFDTTLGKLCVFSTTWQTLTSL